MRIVISILSILLFIACSEDEKGGDQPFVYPDADETEFQDMLQPAFYLADTTFRQEVNRAVYHARQIQMTHPFGMREGIEYPDWGVFGVGKGRDGTSEHHPAVDMKPGDTLVCILAPISGTVHTYRDAPKYRHYISITRNIVDDDGLIVGKLVTILGHVDLDLDEGAGLFVDDMQVTEGDTISQHLYSGTMGGPHLHIEIRYYRSLDTGLESFYGIAAPFGDPSFTQPSAGLWEYGSWNPDIGYGFARPENHGLVVD